MRSHDRIIVNNKGLGGKSCIGGTIKSINVL